MPLLSVFRFIFAIISLVVLASAAYLLWSWYDGREFVDEQGVVRRVREDWRLWTGLALLALSFVGKFLWVPLVARPDSGEPSKAERGNGQTLPGAGGSTLYFETLGPADGRTLILIHGAGMDSTIWHYAKRRLASRFQVIVWDLPGLGQSRGPISLEAYAENLRTVIGLARGRPAVVIGHSMGGMIIQTLARDHPELFGREIAGAVLVNTTYTNPLRTMILPNLAQALRPVLEVAFRLQAALQPLSWLMAWQSYLSGSAHLSMRLGFGPEVTRSQLEHVALLSTRNPPASLAKGNLAMFGWDATGAMAKVPVPVLVIGGGIDIVTKLEASETISATAATAELQAVGRANHMGFLEQNAEYHQLIEGFAERVLPAGVGTPVPR